MKDGFAVRGLDAVSSMMERLEEGALLEAATNGIRAGLDAICEEAKVLCPKDTGNLCRSIAVRMTMDGGEVYAGAPYAAQVEMGTKERPARPFLFPAMRTNEQEAMRCVRSAISRQVKGT